MNRLFLAALALLLAPAAAHAQSSPAPYMSGIRYDAAGRVTGTISADPDGVGTGNPFLAARTTYDGAGRPTRVETGRLSGWQAESVTPAAWAGFTPDRIAETQYDAMGRKTRDMLKRADGTIESLTQYSYDAIGRLDCTAVRMNPAIYGSLPSSACTPGTTGSQGPDRIARTIYDAAGQRLQLREGVGSADEGTEATWAYNANGQVTTVVDGNGNKATLQYDGHGRQTGWTFPSTTRASAFNDATPATALSTAGAVGALQELYEYDLNGNRRYLTKRDGARIEYQYDALNRMTVKIVPSRTAGAQALTSAQVRDVYYGYDLRNLQLSARFDSTSGDGITNAYDGFGRLTSTSINMGGTTRALTYLHDANGNRIRITHPDGNRFETDYDGLNRPLLIWQNEYTAMTGMSYYNHGAVSGLSRANGTASGYGYDSVQRLSGMVQYLAGTTHDATWSYGRNPAGQIGSVWRDNNAYAWPGHYATTRTYTTNGLNQYTAAAGTSLSYDDNGNLIASGSSAYVYDIENRLVGATGGVVLSYDPLGRLYQVSSTAGPTTVFLYDGDALVAEYVSGAMNRRYVHNVGADVPLLSYAGSNLSTPSYLHADERGSIVAISDASGNGAIKTYDEYGIPGAGNTGRFQYTGQIWLDELGMYYYKARIYSPYLGRFLQTDPIGYEGGNNLYAYVGNDPVNLIDPNGTQEVRIYPNGSREVIYTVYLTGSGAAGGRAMQSLQATAAQVHAPPGEAGVRVSVYEVPNGFSVPDTRTFDVSPGQDHVNFPNGQGEGIDNLSRVGHIDSTRLDLGGALMHDTGHPGRNGAEALPDEFTLNASGPGFTPNPGFERNIMGTTTGLELNNAQVDRIQANAFRVCTVGTNGELTGERCK